MTAPTTTADAVEDVESFRRRARGWLERNLPPVAPAVAGPDDDERWRHARELQKTLYAGGFAGICFPREYGGLGLTSAHQRAFTEESRPYEMPWLLNTPTFSVCAATLLDMAGHEQKATHLPAVIRGDEVLVQFLSEPTSGSDLAGVITRADRDGDGWVLNGSKIWSSGAYAADYALCLARTDWTVPKHQGLTMFLVKVHQPGVTIRRITQLNGSTEFCEEFFDDVRLTGADVVGTVNDGWTVASRQLQHERNAAGGGSPYVSGESRPGGVQRDLRELASSVGRLSDPAVREMIGADRARHLVEAALIGRVARGISGGHLPPAAVSMLRLFHAGTTWLEADAGLSIAGAAGVVGPIGEGPGGATGHGRDYLMRQASSLGGGSTEMARNLISERLLGLPREPAPDKGVPFGEVRRGRG